MKKLKKNDLFNHIDKFLKEKGIELRETAPFGNRIKTSCTILTDTINNAQSTLGKARDHMDEHLDKMRGIIHEKTAPKEPEATATKKKAKPKAKKKKATRAKKTAAPERSRAKTKASKKRVQKKVITPKKKTAIKRKQPKKSASKKR